MNSSLQTRLMATFLLVIAALAGAALLILAHARTTAAAYQGALAGLVRVVELTRAVDQGAAALGRLVTVPAPEQAISEYEPIQHQIHRLRGQLPASTVSPAAARLVQDLDSLADSFLIEAGAAMHAFRGGSLDLYFKHDREAATIAGYVRETADRLLGTELDAYRQAYPEVVRRHRELLNMNLAVLGAVTLVAVVFAWSFARGVSDPLRALARAAGRIAGGDLEGPPVPVGAGAELQVLGQAFNHMQENLRRHVAQLQEKADAELRALQSQVQPHFLFNTLNMVAKMALIEGAERTRTLLETVADLLRYSLRQLDRPVTLADEVQQVQRYATIQGERFRERFRFAVEVDPAALATPIPCLTLQPLVENALIHGIGGREEGGAIQLSVRQDGGRVRVVIADDGAGIPPDRLRELMGGGGRAPGGGHTTGLGLHNVRRRLELFYGESCGFAIESRAGEGTRVILDLPGSGGGGVGAHPGGR